MFPPTSCQSYASLLDASKRDHDLNLNKIIPFPSLPTESVTPSSLLPQNLSFKVISAENLTSGWIIVRMVSPDASKNSTAGTLGFQFRTLKIHHQDMANSRHVTSDLMRVSFVPSAINARKRPMQTNDMAKWGPAFGRS